MRTTGRPLRGPVASAAVLAKRDILVARRTRRCHGGAGHREGAGDGSFDGGGGGGGWGALPGEILITVASLLTQTVVYEGGLTPQAGVNWPGLIGLCSVCSAWRGELRNAQCVLCEPATA